MVRVERTKTPPVSLAVEAQKTNGSYKKADVIHQLEADFHHKCYLCELKNPSDIQVEHLHPHHNRTIKERVFDWNNLFFSCPHCNLMKNKRIYDDAILDCCEVDPEPLLNHIFENQKVIITSNSSSADKTAQLIEECFECRNTGIREYQCQYRFHELSIEMNAFFRALEKYKNKPNSPRFKASLRSMLSRESKFAAFKRYYLKTHLNDYRDLESYIA